MENNLNYKLKKIKHENWHKDRTYLHFDLPVKYEKVSQIVKDSSKVAKHAFLPFITFNIKSYKYQYNPETNKKEKIDKIRNISYSSHLDGHIYSYYASMLSKCYEEKLVAKCLSDNVLAFRKLNKNNIDFAKQAFDDIKNFGECSVIALDFSKFFDTLDHKILKEQWCKVLDVKTLPKDHYKVYKSLTKFSVVDRDKVYKLFKISKNNPRNNHRKRICSIEEFRNEVRGNKLIVSNSTNKGIPQGSSISALLSNIYMIDFDAIMRNYVNKFGGKYYRYCDDMLIIAPLDKKEEVEAFAKKSISHLNVKINPEKTEKREFKFEENGKLKSDVPIQYLGFIFDGQKILIRSSSIARYYQKMKKGVLLAKKTKIKRNRLREKKGNPTKLLYKKKLYENYSHLGKSNFITYGLRAKKRMEDSPSIKKQIGRLWKNLAKEIDN